MATVGVDLGGTKLLAGAVGPGGEVLFRSYRRIAGLRRDELLATIEAAVLEAAAAAGGVESAGFGLPGTIERRTGLMLSCTHLPLSGISIAELLRERTGLRVTVDNDATCAALAEWRLGAAKGTSHAVVLTLGTGIGGGLILDGRLYRGATGAAAELGHMPVDLDGPPCFGECRSYGCLEALCGGLAIARDAAAVGLPPDAARVTHLAEQGDDLALELLETVGRRLGAGLTGLAMAFDPEVLVVGGGVMGAGELLLAPARDEMRRRAREPARSVRVQAAALGEDAGMVGAALLAAEEAA